MYNHIICISLQRRQDKRKAIKRQLDKSPINQRSQFCFLNACDWMELRKGLPDEYRLYCQWQDKASDNPWWNRPFKLGEIACSISHIMAWQIASKNEGNTLILEDDAVFLESYNEQLELIKKEANSLSYDLFYLGRNDIGNNWEMITEHICIPSYSYRTHAYIISKSLANILGETSYRYNLIPVDEYLPTLYCKHPRQDIRNMFDLKINTVFAAQPNLIFQTEDICKNNLDSDIENSPSVLIS
jgi:GR25 family glycosyltransferase involved in LPS biosynthesis